MYTINQLTRRSFRKLWILPILSLSVLLVVESCVPRKKNNSRVKNQLSTQCDYNSSLAAPCDSHTLSDGSVDSTITYGNNPPPARDQPDPQNPHPNTPTGSVPVDDSWNASPSVASELTLEQKLQSRIPLEEAFANSQARTSSFKASGPSTTPDFDTKIRQHNDIITQNIRNPEDRPRQRLEMEFRTAPNTTVGDKVRNAADYSSVARAALPVGSDPSRPMREAAVDLADMSIVAGDQEYADGGIELGDHYLQTALVFVDLSLSFAPGIAFAKDFTSLMVGTNVITGQRLTAIDKAIILGGLMAPAMLSGSGRVLSRFAYVAARNTQAESIIARKVTEVIAAADQEASAILTHIPEGAAPGTLAGEVIDGLNAGHVPIGAVANKTAAGLVAENLGRFAKPHAKPISTEALEMGIKSVDNPEKVLSSFSKAAEESGIVVERIHSGTNGKVALIGRSMGKKLEPGTEVGVYDMERHLNSNGVVAKVFEPSEAAGDQFKEAVRIYRENPRNAGKRLPDDLVRQTQSYRENQAWAQELISEGYTVIDLGNVNNSAELGAFYTIEIETIFP